MTVEDYIALTDDEKKALLIDAKKIGQYEDEIATYQLFQICDFFVEVSCSVTHRFRKILKTCSLENIPLQYSVDV